jgi:hypothetical protein
MAALLDRAIVTKMHDLGALRLDQPTHDIDRGVMAVKQARGPDESQSGGRDRICGRGLGGG